MLRPNRNFRTLIPSRFFFSWSESQIPVKVLVKNEDERIPSLFFLVNSSKECGPLEAQKKTKIAIRTPSFALSTFYFYKRKMLIGTKLVFVRLHNFRQFLIKC